MSQKPSTWSRPPVEAVEDVEHGGGAKGAALGALSDAKDRAVDLGEKVAAGVKPVASAVGARVRLGLGKVGDALREGEQSAMPAELLSQADLPELAHDDALASLARRLDREADFWRSVAMRQLGRAAWTERLGVSGSLLLLIGAVVLAAIAAFRALVATQGGGATAMLLGVGLGVLLLAALAIGRLSSRLRQGQLEAAREGLLRADLAEMRLHRIALLLELRTTGRDGYLAALSELEADVRSA